MSRRPELPTVRDVVDAATHCSYCPKMCRFACPVATATARESVTPWGIDRAIVAAAGGEVTEATAAAVYGCTGCRACGSVCLPGLDLPTHVRAARAAVVGAALAPAGIEAEAGTARLPDPALVAGATEGAATVVVTGCASVDDAALARLLAAARVEYDVLREAACCGARAADVGFADAATVRAEEVAGALASARTVVVADPHCARWLRVDCDDGRVVTLPEFLSGILSALRFAAPHFAPGPSPAVVWHDPCWLGRGLGVYDAPRELVAQASGAPPAEATWHRDHAGCTGGGMGYPAADASGADAVLVARADELRATGADVVVTGCPTAAARLRAAGLDAHDLSGYLAARLEDP